MLHLNIGKTFILSSTRLSANQKLINDVAGETE